MPRKSGKRFVEEALLDLWQMRVLGKRMRETLGHPSMVEDSFDQVVLILYVLVKQRRYIHRCPYRPRLPSHIFTSDLQSSDEEIGYHAFLRQTEFLQKYRMSRPSFIKLLSLIQDHQVFQPAKKGPIVRVIRTVLPISCPQHTIGCQQGFSFFITFLDTDVLQE